MFKSLLTLLTLSFCLQAGAAFAADDLPKGWFKAGSDPGGYEIRRDPQNIYTGAGARGQANSISIRGLSTARSGFTTLMQSIRAQNYLGKRVRLSAWVKSQTLTGWAGLWMRIDGEGDKTLGFDNMQNRSITGTIGWKQVAVVLDVPPQSKYIAFGLLSSGLGTVWMDGLKFEVVPKTVPTTNMNEQDSAEQPENLNLQ
ncbi:MAG: hypothetical protein ACAI44_21365 [Candidatus Sericytochromatia bacterium]